MSIETKWTPGPWVVTSGGAIPGVGYSYVKNSEGFKVCYPRNEDANLIAAAPELYEALAELEAMGGLEPSFDSSSDHKEFCRVAQAAMAKARGEHD